MMDAAEKIDPTIPPAAFDINAVRAHVTIIHQRAKGTGGVLVLAVYGESPTLIEYATGKLGRKLPFPTEKFEIGDVDRMVESVKSYEDREHANVYIPLHVMRRDLEPGKRGGTADIVAVLGLVADMDADTGKIGKMPVKPSYIVEASPGNFQAAVLFDRALSVEEAKPLARALRLATGADSGTADVAHVWRVPGTLNWPNAAKIARGRDAIPVPVTIAEPFTGRVYSVDELRAALAPWIPANDDAEPASPPKDKDPEPSSSSTDDIDLIELFLPEELRQTARKPPPSADRSALFMRIVRTLKAQGVSVDRIEKYLAQFPDGVGCKYAGRLRAEIERAYNAPDTKEWNTAGSGGAGASATAGRAASGAGGGGGAAGPGGASSRNSNRPTIRIEAGDLERIVDEAEKALIDADRGVYQRGAEIVTVAEAKLPTFNSGEVIGQRIFKHTESVLAEDLCAAADFVKFDKREKKLIVCDPPPKIVKILSERKGRLKLPILTAIVNVPIIRRDGSIRTKAGYDAETGLLFDPRGTVFPDVAAHPTRADAETALALLLDLVSSFPFVEEADRTVVISAIVTAVHRRAVHFAPLHAFTSPVAGSGKSLLVDIVSMILTGRAAGVIAPGETEEEMEKRLGAIVRYGDPLIAIDNRDAALGGKFLCQLLRQTVVRVRILGLSEVLELPAGTMVTATGNNLRVAGDLPRRTLLCSLDPKTERPELREFDRNPREIVRADRGRFVHAALTLVRAYGQDTGAQRPKPLGSFEDWSNTIRGALVWLGMADPLLTQEKVRANDPKLDELAAVLTHWDAVIGACRVSVAEVIKTANKRETAQFGRDVPEYEHEPLREALLAVAGSGGAISPQRLGIWLASVKGRIVEGRLIEKAGLSGGVAQWRLQQHS